MPVAKVAGGTGLQSMGPVVLVVKEEEVTVAIAVQRMVLVVVAVVEAVVAAVEALVVVFRGVRTADPEGRITVESVGTPTRRTLQATAHMLLEAVVAFGSTETPLGKCHESMTL